MVLWVANRKVYGADKLWKAARRAGHDIGRDQVARLMRRLGIEGCRGGARRCSPPVADPTRCGPRTWSTATSPRSPDAAVGHRPHLRPDPIRDGLCVLHRRRVLPRIVGWRVASNMRTDMVLDALEMARRSRGGAGASSASSHTRCRASSPVVRFTERLDEIGARPSIGTVADSYDNALAETTNGLYKTECVYGPDAPDPGTTSTSSSSPPSPGSTGSTRPAPQPLRPRPPAEFEAAFYAAQQADPAGVGNQ
jgi:putative transposase